jgi:hypothetical protein
MSGDIRADDIAMQASRTFLNIIDASQFTGQIEPRAESGIAPTQSSLTDLQQQVNKVLGNIFAACGT